MKTSHALLGILITGLLGACASSTPYTYWHKAGKTRQQAEAEVEHCRSDLNTRQMPLEQATKAVDYCMRSKDYYLKTGYH